MSHIVRKKCVQPCREVIHTCKNQNAFQHKAKRSCCAKQNIICELGFGPMREGKSFELVTSFSAAQICWNKTDEVCFLLAGLDFYFSLCLRSVGNLGVLGLHCGNLLKAQRGWGVLRRPWIFGAWKQRLSCSLSSLWQSCRTEFAQSCCFEKVSWIFMICVLWFIFSIRHLPSVKHYTLQALESLHNFVHNGKPPEGRWCCTSGLSRHGGFWHTEMRPSSLFRSLHHLAFAFSRSHSHGSAMFC